MKKYVAEFIGTAVLVIFGCGTAMTVGCDSGAGSGYILTALAFGLAIVAMAYSIGNVSGCHVNPAVSLSMLVTGKMTAKDFVGYVVSQVLGALAGTAILAIIWNISGIADATSSYGSNSTSGVNDSIVAALLVEIVLTFVFVFVIHGVTSKTENSAVSGIVIGLTLTFVHILGIGLTGTSVNPARSLAPAIAAVFSGNTTPISEVWIFIVAPLIGGALAGIAYKALAEVKVKEPIVHHKKK
ncbi:MAG: aquaporin [Firmicutes bacterium]|nr:aquaporin [Bacillota bacterium]MCD8314058.1 aquaporin [Bacillota bacterium]